MSYFSINSGAVRYPRQTKSDPGLMRGQLGAIHAIGAHFAVNDEPALIAMPTGSGKTAVLVLAPYVLEAKRVLVATPSRLVAGQIAEQFRSLKLLREIGALGADIKTPALIERVHRVGTAGEWNSFSKYDVVIGTPNTVSPAYADIAEPPEDLFDLLLIDEAHHSPAKTWREMIDAFPRAQRILFTATPFRLDRRELGARFTFVYTVAQAFNDGVFGDIKFLPVDPGDADHDVAIAKAAEAKLVDDRKAGYDHYIMVRTDSTARAEQLAAVYAGSTALRLQTIHSRYSQRTVRAALNKLRGGELDGVISVDMLGEGFDFPSLKVAAVHAPHRSLGSTIQFIGRFARTTGVKLGPATFLAIPSEVDSETKRLYQEEAVWEEMVPNLIDAKVHHEVKVQEDLGSYQLTTVASEEDRDISLWSLSPYFHVKVYRCDGPVDLSVALVLSSPLEVIHRQQSDTLNSLVFITRELSLPRWTTVSQFPTVIHDLFVCYYDPDSNLLFICASRREEGLYEAIASSLTAGTQRRLPLSRLNRALRDLTDQEFFNIGMRNRAVTSSVESYRTLTGPGVHRALKRSDGRLFHQGHSFGRAKDANDDVTTIGIASSSKIWSNRSAQLPDLVDWCRELAGKLSSTAPVETGSEFDFLPTDEEVQSIPPNVIAGTWNRIGHGIPPILNFSVNGEVGTAQLWDVDLAVDVDQSNEDAILFDLAVGNWRGRARFALAPGPTYSWDLEPVGVATVNTGGEALPMLKYLAAYPPTFFFADCSSMEGTLLYRPVEGITEFDTNKIEVVDWDAEGVDIKKECWPDDSAPEALSIHDYMRKRLSQGNDEVVAYDHDTGEVADFIAARTADGVVEITLYHCKGSKGQAPGARVGDVYEVCGQAVKSLAWMRPDLLRERLSRRVQPDVARMVRGTWADLEAILALAKRSRLSTHIVVVQPGIAVGQINPNVAAVLGAANDYVTTNGDYDFRVIGSG